MRTAFMFLILASTGCASYVPPPVSAPAATLSFDAREEGHGMGPFVGYLQVAKPANACRGGERIATVSHRHPLIRTENTSGVPIAAGGEKSFSVLLLPYPVYLECRWSVHFTPKAGAEYRISATNSRAGGGRTCALQVFEGEMDITESAARVERC